jgi:hypothetical protein
MHWQTPYISERDQVPNPPHDPLKAKAASKHNMERENMQLNKPEEIH